jgi:hypothetical protein
MSNCANCGTIRNETTGACPNCSVKKKRIWLWQRLGFIGSGIFIVIGLLILTFSRDLAHQVTCGGPVCVEPATVDVQTFVDSFSQGLQTLINYIILYSIGFMLTIFGIIGLVSSFIAAHRKHQSAFFVDGSK